MNIATADVMTVSSGVVNKEAATSSSNSRYMAASTASSRPTGEFGQLLLQLTHHEGQGKLAITEQSAMHL